MPVLDVKALARSIHFQLDPTTLTGTFTGATIEWRVPGGTYAFGLPFVRTCELTDEQWDDIYTGLTGDPRWGTILPGAEEGETYEYRVTMAGVSESPITGSITTRSTIPPTVVSPPEPITITTTDVVKTEINNYLSSTPSDNRGKEILLERGIYRQAPFTNASPLSKGGDASGWVVIRPKDGDEGLVIFDGSDPTYDVIGGGFWTKYTSEQITDAMDIYCTPWTGTDPGHLYYEDENGNPARILWASKDQMSGGYRDFWSSGLYTLAADGVTPGTGYALVKPTPGSHYKYDDSLQIRTISAPSEGCYCVQDGYMYVHLPDGIDPETVKMKIPSLECGWVIRGADYTKLQGIQVQYFGLYAGTHYDGPGDMEPEGGIYVDNSTGCVFEDLIVRGFGIAGFAYQSNSYRLYDVLFKNCKVQQYGIDPHSGNLHSWDRVKASNSESYGWWIIGEGISLIDCEARGVFNGIDTGYYYSSGYETNPFKYSEYIEVNNCLFDGIPDDAIEPDLFSTSFVASENTLNYCYKGISLAPMESGPVICVRNVYYNSGYYGLPSERMKEAGTKVGNDTYIDIGWKLIAHNTLVNAHTNWQDAPGVGISSEGQSQNLYVYNNYSFSDYACVDFANGRMGYPHVFDYNFYATPGETMVAVGIGLWSVGYWAMSKGQWRQGDPNTSRGFSTFTDWQQGNNTYSGGIDMPGYVAGVTPSTLVESNTAGTTILGVYYPPQPSGWLHDPNSKFEERATSGLVSPETGNFSIEDVTTRISEGTLPVGKDIPSINVDCLPGWSDYEEASPTIGAIPYTPSSPAEATSLNFISQPDTVVAYDSTTFVVEVLDQYGDRFIDTPVSVSIALTNGSGSMIGTSTVDTVAGIATFNYILFDTAGTGKVVTASSSGLAPDISSAFVVTAVPVTPIATSLQFTTEPTEITVDVACTFAVSVLDQNGEVFTYAPIPVTIELTSGEGILSGTLTVNSNNGVAVFDDLIFDTVGTGCVLTANSSTLVSAVSNTFSVSDVVTPPSPSIGDTQVTGDAIDPLIALLVAEVSNINQNHRLAASGYSVLTTGPLDSQPGMPADSSTYRFIKHGDRVVLPPGLTICFIPQAEKEVNRLGPNTSEKLATIDIVCYFTQVDDSDFVDWDLVTRGREGIAGALRSLYNRIGNRNVVSDYGTFYNCSINDIKFRYYERMRGINQGVVAYGVQLTWTGLFYVLEGDTDG